MKFCQLNSETLSKYLELRSHQFVVRLKVLSHTDHWWFCGRDSFNQNFRSKPQWIGSVRKSFWGGPLFAVGPVGILVEWIAPISSEIGLMTRSWQNKRLFAGFSRVLCCSPYLDADCFNLPMIDWNDFTREYFVLQIGILVPKSASLSSLRLLINSSFRRWNFPLSA